MASYTGAMGMDDANVGGPGECPGHEWEFLHVHLKLAGAQAEYGCRWCGTVKIQASGNADFYDADTI